MPISFPPPDAMGIIADILVGATGAMLAGNLIVERRAARRQKLPDTALEPQADPQPPASHRQ